MADVIPKKEKERDVPPPSPVSVRYCFKPTHARELDEEAEVSNVKRKFQGNQ